MFEDALVAVTTLARPENLTARLILLLLVRLAGSSLVPRLTFLYSLFVLRVIIRACRLLSALPFQPMGTILILADTRFPIVLKDFWNIYRPCIIGTPQWKWLPAASHWTARHQIGFDVVGLGRPFDGADASDLCHRTECTFYPERSAAFSSTPCPPWPFHSDTCLRGHHRKPPPPEL